MEQWSTHLETIGIGSAGERSGYLDVIRSESSSDLAKSKATEEIAKIDSSIERLESELSALGRLRLSRLEHEDR